MSNIVAQSTQDLITNWLEREAKGEQFPVDLDYSWQIAGYASKASAKRAIGNFLKENEDYLFDKVLKSTGGRGSEVFRLTCDAFKELCMISRSDIGRNTRRYFIECEKKWKLVEQQHPAIAQEIELERLRLQTAQARAIASDKEFNLIATKNALLASDQALYQVLVEGKPLAEAKTVSLFQKQITEVHTSDSRGISLTQLLAEVGGLTRTKGGGFQQKDRARAKELLKDLGVDLDKGDGCVISERVSKDYSIPEDVYDKAKVHVKTIMSQQNPNLLESLYKKIK